MALSLNIIPVVLEKLTEKSLSWTCSACKHTARNKKRKKCSVCGEPLSMATFLDRISPTF